MSSTDDDAVVRELGGMLARLTALAREPVVGDDAARIDRVAVLEQLRAAVAAVQNTESVAFARSQVESQVADDQVDARAVKRGIADQLGLATKLSPAVGSRRLNTARALEDLPGVNGLLRRGRISEDVAGRVVTETRHLGLRQRRAVDAALVAAGIEQLGAARAAALATKHAYDADPAAYVARGRVARSDRRVSLRPRPDTMSGLDAHLPVEQGVACLAALRRHADTLVGVGGETRTRDQIMADTLVERLTGQASAGDVNVEVGILIGTDTLIDPDGAGAARVVGAGPVPAGIARDILAATTGQRWWRRLFAHPQHGTLVGGDPTRRRFDGVLAHLVRLRDDATCRGPFCPAPGRHLDHILPRRAGGPTSFTNGRATCIRENLVKEMPGWHYRVVHDGLGDHPHTVEVTTPTGHTYLSRAGPL